VVRPDLEGERSERIVLTVRGAPSFRGRSSSSPLTGSTPPRAEPRRARQVFDHASSSGLHALVLTMTPVHVQDRRELESSVALRMCLALSLRSQISFSLEISSRHLVVRSGETSRACARARAASAVRPCPRDVGGPPPLGAELVLPPCTIALLASGRQYGSAWRRPTARTRCTHAWAPTSSRASIRMIDRSGAHPVPDQLPRTESSFVSPRRRPTLVANNAIKSSTGGGRARNRVRSDRHPARTWSTQRPPPRASTCARSLPLRHELLELIR